jgi:hypothetical protein
MARYEITNAEYVHFLNSVKRRGPEREPWFETKDEDEDSHIIGTPGGLFALRGGSWGNDAGGSRAADRYWYEPTTATTTWALGLPGNNPWGLGFGSLERGFWDFGILGFWRGFGLETPRSGVRFSIIFFFEITILL